MSSGRTWRSEHDEARAEQELRAARRARRAARDRREQEAAGAARAARDAAESEADAPEEIEASDPDHPEPEVAPARRGARTAPARDRRPGSGRPAPRRAPARTPSRASRPSRPRSGGSELVQRILVGVPAAVVAIGFVDIGGIAFAVLMALVAVLCLMELNRMLVRWRPADWVGYLTAVGLIAAAHFGSDRTVLEVAMAAVPVTFLAVIAQRRENMPTVSIAGTLLGIVWIGLGFAHAELLRELPHGGSIVIDVMLGTFLADVGAYFGGRLFGRRPLAPSISPKKTVEGLGLGMFTAVLAVFVAGRFQQTWMPEGDSLLLGLVIAVLGPIGDLFESVVKRDAGVKDSGTLFGAHGGALDRLDAILFTAVGGYYVWVGLLH